MTPVDPRTLDPTVTDVGDAVVDRDRDSLDDTAEAEDRFDGT
jgi:ribose 5-phosphate isomerase